MCGWAGESFANWCSWLYLISLHSPAFDVSLLVPYHFAEFSIKDRILTKVSASKALPNHVKSFLENRAITPPFWTLRPYRSELERVFPINASHFLWIYFLTCNQHNKINSYIYNVCIKLSMNNSTSTRCIEIIHWLSPHFCIL